MNEKNPKAVCLLYLKRCEAFSGALFMDTFHKQEKKRDYWRYIESWTEWLQTGSVRWLQEAKILFLKKDYFCSSSYFSDKLQQTPSVFKRQSCCLFIGVFTWGSRHVWEELRHKLFSTSLWRKQLWFGVGGVTFRPHRRSAAQGGNWLPDLRLHHRRRRLVLLTRRWSLTCRRLLLRRSFRLFRFLQTVTEAWRWSGGFSSTCWGAAGTTRRTTAAISWRRWRTRAGWWSTSQVRREAGTWILPVWLCADLNCLDRERRRFGPGGGPSGEPADRASQHVCVPDEMQRGGGASHRRGGGGGRLQVLMPQVLTPLSVIFERTWSFFT